MDLILHLGAHRTGSTAIEQMLMARQAALGGLGVAIWPNARVRRIEGFQAVASGDAPPGAKAAFSAAWHEEVARGMDRLVICEENILGTMLGNLMAASLYPDLALHLDRYRRLFPVLPRRIGLGIRGYAGFWTSSWSYVARRRWAPGIDETAPRIVQNPRGWLDVVSDLRAAFPMAEILIWPQESLAPNLVPGAERLADLPAGTLAAPERRINTSHAAGFLPAMLRLRAANATMSEDAMRAALESVTPIAEYSPFTPDQRIVLGDRYARDLTRLRAGFSDVEVIGA